MSEELSRTELLFGKKGIDKLKNSYVAIFGLGGVGGYVLEALTRSGIGKVDIIDSDKISLSNINRQILATQKTIGEYKTDVAEIRAKEINPDIQIIKHNTFFSPENANNFDFLKYDYVVDAIDTVTGKLELITRCKESNVPIICAMGAGNKMKPEMFEVADISKTSVCPLAKVIRQELKKRRIKKVKVVYSKEIPIKPLYNEVQLSDTNLKNKKLPPASNAFVPSTVGLIIAGEVIKDLIGYAN